MKRLIAGALGFILAFSLCGCASEEVKERQETKKKVQTEAEIANENLPGKMTAFTTVDLDGNEVTEDIFSQADITVVNFWGTFCTPCINEMPDLGAWAKEMPEGAQIIGIMADVTSADSEEFEIGKQIVSETGADFVHLVAGDQFDSIITNLVGVPTTIFYDTDGNMIGQPIVGCDVDGYKARVEEYLND